MPTLDASSTAIFASVGVSATTIYNVFLSLVQLAVAFGLWLVQVMWPFMLVMGFILAMWAIARHFGNFGRHGN